MLPPVVIRELRTMDSATALWLAQGWASRRAFKSLGFTPARLLAEARAILIHPERAAWRTYLESGATLLVMLRDEQ